MTQNAPKMNVDAASAPSRPVLGQISKALVSKALAGATCAVVLSVPLTSWGAMAQGWQVTSQYYQGGATWTYRKIHPGNGAITDMKNGPAPANDCPVLAFEVLNPKRGEIRCVGYVVPWWLR